MEKKRFKGKITNIPPHLIIEKENCSELQKFFLILGLIFNDLKDIIFFYKLVQDQYELPTINETSEHAGEYGGISAHCERLLISIVGEFFIFIKKNKAVTSSMRFQLLLKEMDFKDRQAWQNIIEFERGTGVLSRIATIRSNVTFHYDHNKSQLVQGFKRAFYKEEKYLEQHKKASFSLAGDMEATRFYFSDAAGQSYVRDILNSNDIIMIIQAVRNMNVTIQKLMTIYLTTLTK
jgi:hypothetical protein